MINAERLPLKPSRCHPNSQQPMSWTTIFPTMSDEFIDSYESQSTETDHRQFDDWLTVARVIPPATRKVLKPSKDQPRRIVSATLFWKHVKAVDPELPKPTLENLVMARQYGLVKRFSPWDSYVEPLVRWSPQAMEAHPGVIFRLYLAADLDFLIPRLTELGWEVCLMRSASVRYAPGGFWRFLALEEKNAIVSIIDTDRMNVVDGEIARTDLMHSQGLGLWRVPGYYGVDNAVYTNPEADKIRYRPILGGHFGARGGVPMRKLLEVFIWHMQRGTLPKMANIPGKGEMPINAVAWPDYGCDEWFQLVALYPRLVQRGTLTFVPKHAQSFLLPADIEYVTWANRKSQMIYF
jgi:hypothetical protein